MYKQSFTGTPDELRVTIQELKFPEEVPVNDAVREFILFHIPEYEFKRWTLTIACESASNQGCNRIAGFLAVSAMEE